MNVPTYKRLPGRSLGIGGTSRLYLGPDHILAVQASGYAETYKRFFFADIQAVIVRKTAVGQIWNGIWGAIALLFALIAIAVDDNPGSFVLGGIAALFLLGMFINVLLGPMCACHIKTAVQTERLTAISRMRTAAKLLNRIRPLIASAQGELPREQLAEALDRAQFGIEPATAAPPVVG